MVFGPLCCRQSIPQCKLHNDTFHRNIEQHDDFFLIPVTQQDDFFLILDTVLHSVDQRCLPSSSLGIVVAAAVVGVVIINGPIITIIVVVIITITTLSVCARRELTPASAEKRLLLLMPPLGGLTNYAYRMNVDNLADLLQVSHSSPSLHATHSLA